MPKQTIKAGTQIEVLMPVGYAPERATIGRWTRRNGPTPNHVSVGNGGWHLVHFANNGGSSVVHEDGIRVLGAK